MNLGSALRGTDYLRFEIAQSDLRNGSEVLDHVVKALLKSAMILHRIFEPMNVSPYRLWVGICRDVRNAARREDSEESFAEEEDCRGDEEEEGYE